METDRGDACCSDIVNNVITRLQHENALAYAVLNHDLTICALQTYIGILVKAGVIWFPISFDCPFN
ncbi:hypothetical protein AQUSIP_07560 [Aquicella siphonis]|uniref:Uncharacterized protein n=1 Tax=Aquicella siphonis TaxID=254247 RepID=A0A5E4PGH7_9COXI|nr:hypothetical protein AQUSIP_07560 [Aquicella siphonis]